MAQNNGAGLSGSAPLFFRRENFDWAGGSRLPDGWSLNLGCANLQVRSASALAVHSASA